MTPNRDRWRGWIDRVRPELGRRFGVDLRALAALRIALGFVLLLDLGLRVRDRASFYGDGGVLPPGVLAEHFPVHHTLSIHARAGEPAVQAFLFLLAAGFAVLLLVGYLTRVATVASLAFLVSLQARNPMVLNAGDVLLRRLLFWGVFLPLGERWAVDASSDGPTESSRGRVLSLATAGLLVQVVLVYATNVAFKLRGDAWLSGDAVRYVFGLEQFTTPLGSAVAVVPALLTAATWGWFGLVWLSPLLLATTGRARLALASSFALGHLGMLATMDLGVFPLVSLAALLPFCPPACWDRVERRLGSVDPPVEWRGSAAVVPFSPGTFDRVSRLRPGVLAVAVVLMLASSVVSTGVVAQPEGVPSVVSDRSWDMFGTPPRAEQWYVATGTFESGDAVTGSVVPSRLDRPPNRTGRYPTARWRKYQNNLASSGSGRLHARLAADVCRRWADRRSGSLRSVELVRVTERTTLSGPDRRHATSVGTFDC